MRVAGAADPGAGGGCGAARRVERRGHPGAPALRAAQHRDGRSRVLRVVCARCPAACLAVSEVFLNLRESFGGIHGGSEFSCGSHQGVIGVLISLCKFLK